MRFWKRSVPERPSTSCSCRTAARTVRFCSITREARKHDTLIKYVPKERLDQMSETGKHQGVIAYAAAYEYAEVEDILKTARDKGEAALYFPSGQY